MSRDSTWCRCDDAAGRLSLTLRIQPNARRSEIVGPHGDALKIRIAAPTADNNANAELIRFLSSTLRIPKSAITIRHGATSRRKLLEITGGPHLAARLEALVASRITTHESQITPST